MAGFVSDFGRRPLGAKIAIFAGAGALLGLLYWQLAYEPLAKDVDEARQDVQGEIDTQKRLRREKTEFDKLVVKRQELATRIEQNQKALPTEAEMPAFFEMLSRKISEAGVEPLKRELKKEISLAPAAAGKPANAAQAQAAAAAAAASGPKTVFLKVPVEIELSGTFYQLKRFFASLRPPPADGGDEGGVAKDRLVTIENLQLVDPRVRNNELVVTARFTASTFRAMTETPPAAPGAPAAPAAGAGAGAGAGTGAGTGATSRDLQGPASTPGAARAQTGAAGGAAADRLRVPGDEGGE